MSHAQSATSECVGQETPMSHNAHAGNLASALWGAALLILVGCALAFTGCRRPSDAAQRPPAMVTAARPVQREVIEWDEYTGNLESPDHVDVRARVSGQIVDAP